MTRTFPCALHLCARVDTGSSFSQIPYYITYGSSKQSKTHPNQFPSVKLSQMPWVYPAGIPWKSIVEVKFDWLLFFSAFNIKCPVCTNIPHMGARKCDSYYVESKTCPMGLDKCMTVTGQMKDVVGAGVNFPTKFEVKNCSNSLLCEGGSDLNSKKRTTV